MVWIMLMTAQPAAPQQHPSLVPVEDVAGLPRVLLIGDSISMGYTVPTRELLAGKANVHRIPENGGPTSRGVQKMDAWLGDEKWDLIHFNFGLHDLKMMEDGSFQVPMEPYEQNLRQLVHRMTATGAKLIWCSTTPVPDNVEGPARTNEDVCRYNAVAKAIMDEHAITIDDLYSFALPKLAETQLPANVHFSPEGSKVLAQQVAASIEAALAE